MRKRDVSFRRVVSALCAVFVGSAWAFSPGGVRAALPESETVFAKMCRGEAAADQERELRHYFGTRKTRDVLDRALRKALTWRCTPETVDMLLGAGASPNAKYWDGTTVLMKAAGFGEPRIVARLLEAGADRNVKDYKGRDALRHAREGAEKGVSEEARAEVIRLLEGGADKPAAKKER